MRRALVLAAALPLLQACATLRPSAACDCGPLTTSWTETLRTASDLAEAGRFAAVDSLLAAYAEQHQDTRQGREVVFWRALYQLDPRNPAPRAEAAALLLDWYLVSDSVHWYRSEARLLRQLAELQSPGAVTAARPATPPATPPVVRPSDPPTDKDLEIQQLRQRVAQLNDELERIKRRLSAP